MNRLGEKEQEPHSPPPHPFVALSVLDGGVGN